MPWKAGTSPLSGTSTGYPAPGSAMGLTHWPGGQGEAGGPTPLSSSRGLPPERAQLVARCEVPGVALSLPSGLGKVIPLSGSQLSCYPTEARARPLNFPRDVQSKLLLRAALSSTGHFNQNQPPKSS